MATILIVDDRPTNREYLVTLLGYGGHRLLEASDGAEALAIARAEHPDLVIADILMPTMDGYEFVRQVRADPAIASTPVIFYTAHYHVHEARALADACGVAHVLSKPAEPEVVLRTVDAALGVAPAPVSPPSAQEFDREHLRLLTDKLSQKAEELRRANARLSALVELGLELGTDRAPEKMLQSFCHAAREITGAKYAITAIVDSDGSRVRYFFTSGMDPETAARLGTGDSRRGGAAIVLRESRAVRLHNPDGNPAALDFPESFPPFHAWLGAPIVSPGRVFGWLGLVDKVGAEGFSDEDERLARILAAQVGRIYENSSLYADVLRHASELELEIAERRRAEASLKESEERFRELAENIREVFWLSDPINGKVLYVSPAFEAIWGRPCASLYTSPQGWIEAIHLEDRERVQRAFLKQAEGHYDEAYRITRPDGSVRWIHDRGFPVRNAAGEVYRVAGVAEDITAGKNLEEQFRQAQKMEAVGQLAGGVAHDFNNLLTIINGCGELLAERFPRGDPTRNMLDQIVAAGFRAAGLTRQLLTFSRKAIIEPRVLDIKTVVVDVDKMLRRIIGEDIQLNVVADPHAGAVKADPGQIEQVLLNLVVNARDAMPQGGRLTIEVRNADVDETYVQEHVEARPGHHVMLAISDTGCGMDRATLTRIFEPFFSTKGERGTGLGLATVHGIVKQSGGHVAVYSEVGHGTTFKVYLPRVRERPLGAKSHTGVKVLPRGRETILVVEDEEGVRILTGHVLRNCGYKVLAAGDGIDAVRIADAHEGKIDLIVTDVVMPRMGGREVVEQIAARHPSVKVLFLSGYTDDAVVRHGILQAEVAFLQKPYSPASLAVKVREVLDGQVSHR